jgi:flagellar biosynthesis anti-sigma factor FlgM
VKESNMRIDANSRLGEMGDAGNSTPASPRVSAAANPGKVAGDTAEISGDAMRVQSLATAVQQLPEIRQEKVAALSLAVREGRYEVSPEQTADALVAEMQSRFAA